LLFSFLALLLLFSAANGSINTKEDDQKRDIIGAIVDYSSRVGKEEKVAMEMAIKDIYDKTNQSFVLRILNSQRVSTQAVIAAKDLINTLQVQVIIGPQTWEEASLVADMSSQAQIPLLSLADTTPQWAMERWPFLIQAVPNQFAQMKAVAAIIQSWEWHQVNIIHEDTDSSKTGVLPHLYNALREVGVEISDLLAIPPLPSSSLSEGLKRLNQGQCRVFVVHLSSHLAIHLFEQANKMKMMEKDYVWITTDPFTSVLHSINASTISSMQGIVGVKSYLPVKEPLYEQFYARFRRNFRLEHPEEENHEPGIFAMQAYDAVWKVCLAMKESNKGGKQLLDKIFQSNQPHRLSKNGQLDKGHIFKIVNVMGKSYQEVGFWSQGLGLGFSRTIDDEAAIYYPSMKSLGLVFWPGGPWTTPRGWTHLPRNANPLRIGVPTGSTFKQFVNVVQDQPGDNYSFQGFAINLFEATIKQLPYSLPHNFFAFNGSYDAIVEQVYLNRFDAVVGDVAVVSRRYQHAEFTQPYTESGLVMIVPVRSRDSRAWLFMKPFTKAMWALTAAITVYNGFVVWLIEKKHYPELRGSAVNQIGTLISLSFTTLFSLTGEKLHSNQSRIAMVMWLFVALVITQTYTANLTSILTVKRLDPTVKDIESLQKSNAMVGQCRGSFVARYLTDVLHFHPNNIKNYTTPEHYAQGLRSGEIAAAFLEAPFAKLFLAKYCKDFIAAGPTYSVGGFGFVFPKGSLLLPDVTKALLQVSESGKQRELENDMLTSDKCVGLDQDDEISSLSPNNFWVLFILSGGTSTAALIIFVVHRKWKFKEPFFVHTNLWMLMLAVIRHWGLQKRRFSRKIGDVENPIAHHVS
ncbi:Lig_chan domain-containing protein/SBP_bac_3 domain-containing protein/ANF_receptor domain-containing protein, partial [Cephalotus follicularis]